MEEKKQYQTRIDALERHQEGKAIDLSADMSVYRPLDGEWFGNWQYEQEADAITHGKFDTLTYRTKGNVYEIELSRCEKESQIYNWIFHLACKTWITPEDLGNLVLALHHIKQVYR